MNHTIYIGISMIILIMPLRVNGCPSSVTPRAHFQFPPLAFRIFWEPTNKKTFFIFSSGNKYTNNQQTDKYSNCVLSREIILPELIYWNNKRKNGILWYLKLSKNIHISATSWERMIEVPLIMIHNLCVIIYAVFLWLILYDS